MEPLFNRSRRMSLLALLLASAAPCAVLANPVGGHVAAGSASIESSIAATGAAGAGNAGTFGAVTGNTGSLAGTANKLTITQSTDKAVIDWRGFDIAKGETTEFKQPRAESITLNRVNSANPSYIDGHLTANGNLLIVNQNGVLFGKNSVVDVNGLVASTADIDNNRFMTESKLSFDKPGNPNAAIINEGRITAKEAGLVGLVAPNVLNSGVIEAKLGRIHLASGDAATVDFYGDGLIEVRASEKLEQQIIANTGTLKAEGGKIALTAAAAKEAVNSLIQVSGELNAKSVGVKNGEIHIFAEGSNAVKDNIQENKSQRTGSSTVLVDATINASGRNEGERGGKISVLGDKVTIKKTAELKADGQTGGGTIHVGGQYQGKGTTPTALTTLIEQGALLSANATNNGNGGEVIVWSDRRTDYFGSITATGAGNGNGGFVETSSHGALLAFGTVSATSVNGKAGKWLLDPADIEITANTTTNNTTTTPYAATGTDSQVSAANIKANLDGGTDVTVTTSNDGFAGSGDITVTGAISTTGGGSLTLSAYRDIVVNNTITLSGGSLTLRSANSGNNIGAINIAAAITTNGGNVTIGGGSGAISAGVGYAVGDAQYTNGVLINASINSGAGAIIVNGQGYGVAGSYHTNGIYQSSGTIQTTSGSITLNGLGGAGTSSYYNMGVTDNGTIRSVTGAISLTGTGGSNSYGWGVWTLSGSIQSTGTGDDASTITIYGTGGSIGEGVAVYAGTNIASVKGNILIIGVGGPASKPGIFIYHASSSIVSTGSANITLNGTGSGSQVDIEFGGNVSNPTYAIGGPSDTGSITLNANNSGKIGVGYYSTCSATLSIQTSGTVSFNGILNAGGTGNIGNITAVGGTIAFSGYDWGQSYSLNSVSLTSTNSMTLPSISAASLTAVTTGATADLALGSSKTLTVSGTGNALTLKSANAVILNSSSAITMSGGGNVILWSDSDSSQAGNIQLSSATITSNGGNVTLAGGADDGANGGTASDGIPDNYAWGTSTSPKGVYINGGGISTGFGSVTIRGNAYSDASASNLYGVIIYGAAVVQTSSGTMSIAGIGGVGVTYNVGVAIHGTNTQVRTTSGAITITGTGNTGTGNNNHGIDIYSRATVSSSGTGASVGAITLNGTAGSCSSSGAVFFETVGTVSSVDGAIIISGFGQNYGVDLYRGAIISTGNGAIRITGTGLSKRAIIIAGAGGYTSYLGYDGMNAYSGDISLISNNLNLGSGTIAVQTTGTLTIKPYTASTTMGVGPSSGSTLNVSDAILGIASAGSYIFGSTDAGKVTINTAHDFGSSNVTFISGNNIELAGTLTKATGAGAAEYQFKAYGDIYNSSSAGITASSGSINLLLQSDYDASGAGAISLTGGTITTNGGNITMGGGSGAISAGSGYAVGSATYTNGIYLTTSLTSGAGNIILNGQGYAVSGSYDTTGVYQTSSTIQTTSGSITFNGIGRAYKSSYYNFGVAPSTVTSETGAISITGIGGTDGNPWGIWINGTISSTGTGADASTITLHGTGGQGGDGTAIKEATISTVKGDVSITGIAGSGSKNGIYLYTNNSSGSIVRSTGSANITFNGTSSGTGSDILFRGASTVSHTYVLGGAGDTGAIVLNANGSGKIGVSIYTAYASTLSMQTQGVVTFNGTVDARVTGGLGNVTAIGGSITFNGNWGQTYALTTVSLTSTNSLTLPSISASSILARTTGATADLTIASGKTLTASGTGDAVVLASGRNFINSSGSGAISLTGSGRWLVFSADPAANTYGGLNSNNTAVWHANYGDTISQTGNRYVFSYQPTVTFTSINDSKTYGTDATAQVAADYSISGLHAGVTNAFLADSNATAFSGTPGVTSLGSPVSATVSGSPYAITVAQGTLSALNGYALGYSSAGALTVNTASLTLTADDRSKTYGVSLVMGTTAFTITSGTLYNGDTVTGATLTSAGAAATAVVGTYTITPSAATGTGLSNYTISYVNAPTGLTVSAAPLTIRADNQSKTYGTLLNLGTTAFTVTGTLYNSDAVTGATLTSAGAAAAAVVNVYTLTPSAATGTGVSNYAITYSNAPTGLTVNKAPLTITADTQTITYGTTVPAGTASYAGFVLGEGPGNLITLPTISSAKSGLWDVGTYAANYAASGAVAQNYSLTYATGDLIIQKRALSVNVDNKAIMKGQIEPVFTGSNDLIEQDAPLITWTYEPIGYIVGTPGTYVINATSYDPLGRLANYTTTIHTGRYAVSKLPDSVMIGMQGGSSNGNGSGLNDDGFGDDAQNDGILPAPVFTGEGAVHYAFHGRHNTLDITFSQNFLVVFGFMPRM